MQFEYLPINQPFTNNPSVAGAATEGYIEGGQAASVRSYGFTVSLTF